MQHCRCAAAALQWLKGFWRVNRLLCKYFEATALQPGVDAYLCGGDDFYVKLHREWIRVCVRAMYVSKQRSRSALKIAPVPRTVFWP